jgi:ubiquinone/menaquinone biosynthesis C-methylase UbiE
MNEIATPTIDLAALKAKQQATWASGDYAAVGTTLQIVGEQLCETFDLRPGSRVLDVAAGNGNATLAAARRFCDVTSTDYVPALLARGEERAVAERLRVGFQVEDAEDLSFPDASFDVVLSTFGVMFVADHERAAREMTRVCRPGGVIAMANWTPEGFIGRLFKTIGKHVPPPPGARSPALWGTEAAIRAMFGEAAASITMVPRSFAFRYRSPAHFVEHFRTFYGPMHKAFLAAGENAPALEADIRALLDAVNLATDGTLVAPSDYVEVVIRKG